MKWRISWKFPIKYVFLISQAFGSSFCIDSVYHSSATNSLQNTYFEKQLTKIGMIELKWQVNFSIRTGYSWNLNIQTLLKCFRCWKKKSIVEALSWNWIYVSIDEDVAQYGTARMSKRFIMSLKFIEKKGQFCFL